MTTTLYLIRHGETDWNATGRWQGHADVPLNARGLHQARLLASRLQTEGVQFDAIYSSDLKRAFQTAWEVGAALKVAVQLWPPLREIDLGKWSGLTREEIRTNYPDDYARLKAGEDVPRGGAETSAALRKRVVESVEAMVTQHPAETLALVSHGGPVRSLVSYVIEKYGADVQPNRHIGNTSITVLHCHSYLWEISTYNDTRHLHTDEFDLVSQPPDDAERPEEQS